MTGLQRHIKAIGIFSRLNYRDNKDNYLQDIPRTYSYIEKTLKKYKDLTNLNEIFSDLNLLRRFQNESYNIIFRKRHKNDATHEGYS